MELLAGFTRMLSAFVECFSNVERSPVALTSTFDGSGTQRLDVEMAVSTDPTQASHVAQKDFVRAEL